MGPFGSAADMQTRGVTSPDSTYIYQLRPPYFLLDLPFFSHHLTETTIATMKILCLHGAGANNQVSPHKVERMNCNLI